MSTYLKNMAGYKHNQLKSKSYDEIQEIWIDEHVKAKGDDDQEEAEMKKHMEIVQDDEVAIDAIPLATRPPVIVEWKIIKEGKMRYFQLIRADGSSKKKGDNEEEREMEPKTGILETLNRGNSRVKETNEGGRPLEEASRGNGSQNVNLPPLLAAHIGRSENGQPLQSSLTSVYKGQALPNKVGGNLLLMPMYTFPNMPAYANPNSTGLFPNPLGSVTPFAYWIVDYPLPDGLKMPSHISSYDGKGDPDNFSLHLFEGAYMMHKWFNASSLGHKFHTKKESEPYSRLAKLGKKRRRPEEPLPSKKKGYPAVMTLKKKSSGNVYQRLVDKVFSKQIGRNLEAYVDDMVIKSTSEEGMLSDIQENFERFRLINMKLNPKKCSFGVEEGAELNYPALEKLILALVHEARRLRRYFQARFTIMVPTDERETPADFLPEIPFDDSEKKVKEKEVSDPSNEWKLYTNGASSDDGVGAVLMLIDPAESQSRVTIGHRCTWKLQKQFKTMINARNNLQQRKQGRMKTSQSKVEAKPITVKNEREVEKFVWEYVVCRFGVPRMISLKEEKHFKEGTLADFCKGLKITQTFSPITEHMEIMHYIEKQPVRSQQGWVDNLAKELWVHRTLPRNSQEETPFSLTYGSEAVVPIVEATDDRGRTQETTKKCKEIASIEKAHYRNKLEKYHITRNNYSNYIVGDFVLFPTSLQEQQGPHMISEVHKDGFYTLVNIADHSLVQKAKGTSLVFMLSFNAVREVFPCSAKIVTQRYGNPPRKGLCPSREVFDETRAKIPNNTTSERPPVITTVFAATTPENTPFAYRASTSANPNPMISLTFVEANYEVLESLLRERRRQIRNEDLRSELEYFSEDYDEEREMEPRPEPNWEATLTLRLRSPMVRRQRERVVGFEEAPNREGSRRGRNAEGIRPSEIKTREYENRGVNLPPLLAAHLGRNESSQPLRSSLTSVHGGHQPSTNIGGNLHPNGTLLSRHAQPFIPSSLHTLLDLCLFMLTPTPNHLRALSIGILGISLSRPRVILGLHEEQRVSGFGHGLRTRSLVEHLSTCLPSTYKGQRSLFGRTTKGRKAGIGSPPTVDLVIPRLPRNKWSRDKNKYCHFHKDHEYDTNQYRELKHQIEEAVKYGQLVHLVKRVKKKEKVDLKILLVDFSGEKSWPLGEVPLEITIGEGIGTILSQYNPREPEEEQRATSKEHQEEVKDILNCVDAEERIVVNDQYPEHTITIGRQLPTKIKIRLQGLLRAYADVFAWTTAHMTVVPRTIIIGGETFNTEHKVNRLKHLEPVKQKKRSLAPERNEAIYTQVEELTNANIL
ncbi:reverse transcriptase domain-containing protein [Tanacetum coccineum]